MTTAPKSTTKVAYENNPFFVAVNGLEILFKKAQAIGIALIVILGLSTLASLPSAFVPPAEPETPQTSEQIAKENESFERGIASISPAVWIVIGFVALGILLLLIVFGIVVQGVIDFTAAQLANGREVGLSDAFRGLFSNFWGYVWVMIIAGVKTFLWTLLLVVPGFIMYYRYSLAGVVFFDKKLKGNASVKESARLTKNGWFTTFASQSLFNLITLGMIELLLVPGTNAVLYRQFRTLDAAGQPKPAAHVLSWLTLFIPLFLVVSVLIAVFALVVAFAPAAHWQ